MLKNRSIDTLSNSEVLKLFVEGSHSLSWFVSIATMEWHKHHVIV